MAVDNYKKELSELIHSEGTHILYMLETNDMSRASRRMMDFCNDFFVNEKLGQTVTDNRLAYLLLSGESNMTNGDTAEWKELRFTMSELAKKLIDDAQNQIGFHKEIKHEKNKKRRPGLGSLRDYETYVLNKTPGQDDNGLARVLTTEKLCKSFKNSPGGFKLEDITLDLNQGEIVGILGENGNGKTVLLNILSLMHSHDSGSLEYHFRKLDSAQAAYDIKSQMAYIPQRLAKWFGPLETNLQYAASIHGIRGAENTEAVNFILYRLGLHHYRNHRWSEISGGYQMRYELAKMMVWRPKMLILDEPLANLDINAQTLFLQDLKDMAKSHRHPMGVIISSQHLQEVENIADKILFLRNGKVEYYGRLEDFATDRDHNIFELDTDISQKELMNKLLPLIKNSGGTDAGDRELKIDDNGQAYVIKTPTDIKTTDILQHLAKEGVDVQYFRDISQSTRKLFSKTT